jgi:hypothetical protein
MISAPPANEIRRAYDSPHFSGRLADGHSFAIGPHCDKGTTTGGCVIFWLTESIAYMKQQVRAQLRKQLMDL